MGIQVGASYRCHADGFGLRMLVALPSREHLLGLQWADVDLEAGLLHVRRQLQSLPGRVPERVEVKTRRSRRTISIPDGVVAIL